MIGQQIINGLMLGSVYAMVAVALTLSIGVLNFLNFSIPGLFMIGGMGFWALTQAGVPWPLAILGALTVAAAISMIVERFTWRWLRGAEPFVPLVSSMAFLILFEHLAVVIWGSEMRPLPLQFAGTDWRLGPFIVSVPQLLGLGLSLASILTLSLVLRHTRLGRGLRTIAEDSETALMLGVDVNQLVPVVFVLAGLFAAVAGALFAIDYRQVHPFMGEAIGLKGISAMIVGGMGNVWGAIAGGLIIGIAEVLSVGYLGANFVDISVFGLVLAILIVWPAGLFGDPGTERVRP
jgi:branched-chain amino acid transport system permease protein